MFSNKRAKPGGFTLIELLVVIAIIGVLASIVLASLNTTRRKSRDTRRVADIKQIQLALELYFDANRQYPASGTLYNSGVLAPSYIPTVPPDPLGGNYRYCRTATTSYHLGGSLEENLSGGPLSSDRDLSTASCTGGDTIDGDDADDCANTAGRYCYDVTS